MKEESEDEFDVEEEVERDVKTSKKISYSNPTTRNVILLLSSIFPFFSVFLLFDAIGSLAYPLSLKFDLTPDQIGYLYSAWSISTPFTTLAAGFIIDRLSAKSVSVVIIFLVMVFTLLLTISVSHTFSFASNYHLMLVSRFFSGFFAEPIIVAGWVIISECFSHLDDKRWMSFAFAATNTVGLLGNTAVFILMPIIHQHLGLTASYIFVFLISVLAFIVSVIYYFYERNPVASTPETAHNFHIRDLKRMSLEFWYLNTVHCLTTIVLIISISFGSLFLIEEWNYSESAAGVIIAIMNALVLLALPGAYILERKGYKCTVWCCSCLLMCISYFALSIKFLSPVLWMLTAAVGFSPLSATVITGVNITLPEDLRGTGFGIISFTTCAGLFLLPIAIGNLRNSTGEFVWGNRVFALLSLVAAVVAFLLLREDKKNGSRLENPMGQRSPDVVKENTQDDTKKTKEESEEEIEL